MSLTELERDYSPSQWSKRYSAEKVLEHYINYITKASNKVRLTNSELDVQYGPSENQKLDIFGTNLKEDVPIFVFIHGGYWQEYSRQISCYMSEVFVKNNIKTIVIGYDLCPHVTLFNIVDEVSKALKKCLEITKSLGSKGMYIAGHSSGAHLVSTLLENFFVELSQADRELIKAMILISGIYDIRPLINTYANDALKLKEKDAEQLSPLLRPINVLNMKIIFIIPEHESPSFKKQSEVFAEKLKSTNNEIITKYISGVDHFDVVEKLTDENYELTQIIFNIIFNKNK